MYVLLQKGIKPWDTNGGYIYKDDLTYIVAIARLEIERENKYSESNAGGAKGDWKKVSISKE